MSATMQRDWLKTVDFKDRVDGLACLRLSEDDRKQGEVQRRWNAKKPLTRANATMGDASNLADEVWQAHKLGTRTIVVVNTVRRACELFIALNRGGDGQSARGKKAAKKQKPQGGESEATMAAPRIVLLHSRFRPNDRKERIDAALADPPAEGTIVVSTQVIEAGVDVSATTLFTELAPWSSLVQRFGRCNRRGEQNELACVRWIDLSDEETFKRLHPAKVSDKDGKPITAKRIKDAYEQHLRSLSLPYGLDDLRAAAVQLAKLNDVGLKSLPGVELPFEHTHVIRRKDLIDLFDTTPDLAGNDIDIDRFVREVEDSDVRAFWRDYGDPKKGATPNRIGGKDADDDNPGAEPAPRREELCPVPIGSDKNPDFRQFAKRHSGQIWRWDFLNKKWVKAEADKIVPGQVFLVHVDAGGYSVEKGWDQASTACVEPAALPLNVTGDTPDATDDDRLCRVDMWLTIAEHADEVCKELDAIVAALVLDGSDLEVLRKAARWHDRGKAHEVFVSALPDGVPDAAKVWAKGAGRWKRYGRPHFRHELASALAVLLESDGLIPLDTRDLLAYLVAAHHGKVRLSIRSLPNETRPDGNRRFARGVWDGDELPETDLGQDGNGRRIIAPKVTLSLEPMELGLCEQPPFAGQPSWAERMIRLRDRLGSFRLAYLEAILRAADMRASKAAEQRAATDQPVGSGADGKGADHG